MNIIMKKWLLIASVLISGYACAKPYSLLVQESPDKQKLHIYISDFHIADPNTLVQEAELTHIMQSLGEDACCVVEDLVIPGTSRVINNINYLATNFAMLEDELARLQKEGADHSERRQEIEEDMRQLKMKTDKCDYNIVEKRYMKFLNGLYDYLTGHKIETYNAELRFWMLDSLHLTDASEYQNKNIAEVRALNTEYAHRCIETTLQMIDACRKNNRSIDESTLNPLLDARAVHCAEQANRRVTVFALGGSHIQNIAKEFLKRGWNDIFFADYNGHDGIYAYHDLAKHDLRTRIELLDPSLWCKEIDKKGWTLLRAYNAFCQSYNTPSIEQELNALHLNAVQERKKEIKESKVRLVSRSNTIDEALARQ